MELSQLTMFKAVADQGSIVRAAEQLHCVPSNITNRIKLLERELGVSLFVRKGRGLVISPAGRLFLEYVNKILSLCQESQRVLDPAAAPSGNLKIGAIESSATGRLPRFLARYHQLYPLVQMQFSTGDWSQLLNDVVGHKLDGAIIAVRPVHPDIASTEIYKEELVLIASASAGRISGPQDLSSMDIFMWPEGCPYRGALENWLSTHEVSSPITNIASYGTILGCVSSGAGASLVPRGIFEQFKNIGSISGYVFDDLFPVQNYLMWNKHVEVYRARDKFVELLIEEFKEA
ncbi:LysR family transcriptional regulator [Pseudomonas sp. 21TX0197]|uniref:LysR family transcriptional regulator n=1 Tax=unclassified Pseudomonas TaxID=196821 RepID=UPI0009538B24|nr:MULTISPECIES: LysR family transcriptional regulator [unclassified Pseudomonas]MDB6442965.1 LysR family transcriptional regulator [Pseudomonas sp. 21TX0197]ROO38333.1 LysR family transcriptional regulator [Pseudomonas sp. 7SR1]SIR90834.1 DNA-binding transcriptional regulator, LysR family [Pseudomonas sp. 7SR1]